MPHAGDRRPRPQLSLDPGRRPGACRRTRRRARRGRLRPLASIHRHREPGRAGGLSSGDCRRHRAAVARHRGDRREGTGARPHGDARDRSPVVDDGGRRRRARRGHGHVVDRVHAGLGRGAETARARGVRHPFGAHRRPPGARRGIRGRPRRALRHVSPAAPPVDGRFDRAARRPRQAAPPAPAAQPLGQPERIDRARLRGSLVVEVGRAAGGDRSEAARLRARERVARPERRRSQQRERERAVAYRWLHRQGRRHRRHVPA